jgi:hypothetical protein
LPPLLAACCACAAPAARCSLALKSKSLTFFHLNALQNHFLLQTIPCVILSQATWIKRAVSAWEMGGWMKGLAEGGYGINIARNVAIMQELQVCFHLCLDVTAEVRCSRPYLQAALELQPGNTSASADERSIASPRGSIGRASNSSPIPAFFFLCCRRCRQIFKRWELQRPLGGRRGRIIIWNLKLKAAGLPTVALLVMLCLFAI